MVDCHDRTEYAGRGGEKGAIVVFVAATIVCCFGIHIIGDPGALC